MDFVIAGKLPYFALYTVSNADVAHAQRWRDRRRQALWIGSPS